MKSFGQWFADMAESIPDATPNAGVSTVISEPDEDELPEGLYMRGRTLYADCRSCGREYEWPAGVEDYDADMSYCGGSPHCCP